MNDFFDHQFGTISPTPNERSVNGFLFLLTYVYLKMINNESLKPHKHDLERSMMFMYNSKERLFSKNPWHDITKGVASHDDFTACISASKKFDLFYHKKNLNLKPYIKYMWRDPVYYAIVKNKWYSVFLKPILSATMIFSCRYYMAPNGLPDTDGKILAWIRLNTISMPWTWKICTKMINKHFGNWGGVLLTFHRMQGHPIRNKVFEMQNNNSKWSLLYKE